MAANVFNCFLTREFSKQDDICIGRATQAVKIAPSPRSSTVYDCKEYGKTLVREGQRRSQRRKLQTDPLTLVVLKKSPRSTAHVHFPLKTDILNSYQTCSILETRFYASGCAETNIKLGTLQVFNKEARFAPTNATERHGGRNNSRFFSKKIW